MSEPVTVGRVEFSRDSARAYEIALMNADEWVCALEAALEQARETARIAVENTTDEHGPVATHLRVVLISIKVGIDAALEGK